MLLKRKFLTGLFVILVSHLALCQGSFHKLTGRVTSETGEPVVGAYVYLRNTSNVSETDEKGYFSLRVHPGKHAVVVSMMGYEKSTKNVTIEAKYTTLDFALKPSKDIQLQEVGVKTQSQIAEVRESPFNVVALDAKAFANTTLDLGQMLDKASGVKIRETGGMGSSMSISLNGFTGRHIKLFMDGVPMQGFGSAFQLNNIPVNVADRIEVYKGVVPVEFGADAMGGAINIVTNQSANSFLDASYSYGSFNTHKTNVSIGHTTKNGFTFQLNAFQNYSDNNYKVRTTVLNLQTGNYSNEEYNVRRFNDAYHNETIMAKVGFVGKPWADRFLIGLTLGKEYAQIQNANVMKIVYGQRARRATTVLPSLQYEKRNLLIKNLNLRLTANYNRNYNQNIDTAARQYNWFGEFRKSNSMGEATYSLAEFFNNNYSSTANLSYRLSNKHSFSVNDVITGYVRKNANSVGLEDVSSPIDTMRRSSLKNVLGASYRYHHNEHWNANLFGKFYAQKVTGPIDTSGTSTAVYEQQTKMYSVSGYGMATTYFLRNLQFKASIEKAYRLPTDTELFGDEITETGNASLKAEHSMNYNLGATMNKPISENHTVYIDINAYYRDIRDYIQRLIEQRYGSAAYSNHGKVRNMGVDAEIRYYYKNRFMVGGNVTYQDMRNKEKYASSTGTRLSVTYNDRMRNVPYFFGNIDGAYYLHDLLGKGNVLSLGYNFNFVGKFYLNWESLGDQGTKATLPQQLYHDFNMTYMMKNGKYNIAFEARNFTNAMLYDNYSLQKPGRSFAVKLRYFLMKRGS